MAFEAGYQRHSSKGLSGAFNFASEDSTSKRTSAFEASLSSNQPIASKVLKGQNFSVANNSAKPTMNSFQGGGNLKSAKENSAGAKATAEQGRGQFVGQLKEAQSDMHKAIKQACENTGADHSKVAGTLAPQAASSDSERVIGMAASGATHLPDFAFAMIDVVTDVKKERGMANLSKDDVKAVIDDMKTMMTPAVDLQGNVVQAAVVSSTKFDFQGAFDWDNHEMVIEQIQEFMKPPEMHPEYQALNDSVFHAEEDMVAAATVEENLFNGQDDKLAKMMESDNQAAKEALLQGQYGSEEIKMYSDTFNHLSGVKLASQDLPVFDKDVENAVAKHVLELNQEHRDEIDLFKKPVSGGMTA